MKIATACKRCQFYVKCGYVSRPGYGSSRTIMSYSEEDDIQFWNFFCLATIKQDPPITMVKEGRKLTHKNRFIAYEPMRCSDNYGNCKPYKYKENR